MKTKKSLFAGVLLATVLMMGFTSCKKCTVAEEDTNTGVIIQEVIIYPKIGYLANVTGNHVTGASLYANEFEVSWDGGETKVPVDWNSYDILANPMNVNCKASFVRDVTYNNAANLVLYDVIATTCASCENQRYVENFVLIPKVASGYSVYTDQTINTN